MKQIILDLNKTNTSIEIEEDTEMIGIFIGKDSDSINSELTIIHKKPNLISNCQIKSVLTDKSKENIKCNLHILTDSSQTESIIKLHTLILSQEASAVLTPALEISENTVKATHACSATRLDKELVEYMLSRGIDQRNAIKLQAEGFILDLVNQIKDDKIKSRYIKELKSINV